MVENLKPIQTKYRGYRFRSRLEARWAVFLDTIKSSWEYEPEGFQLQSGWYLPDFWLPEMHAFLEIKPSSGNRDDDFSGDASHLQKSRMQMCELVTRAECLGEDDKWVGARGIIAVGEFWDGNTPCLLECGNKQFQGWSVWDRCVFCKKLILDGPRLKRRSDFGDTCPWGSYEHCFDDNAELREVKAANLRAQQARFEHGGRY